MPVDKAKAGASERDDLTATALILCNTLLITGYVWSNLLHILLWSSGAVLCWCGGLRKWEGMKTPPAQQVIDGAETFVDSIGDEMSEGVLPEESMQTHHALHLASRGPKEHPGGVCSSIARERN